ncbi:hypothetical protein FQA39_LY05005 [Lamprigera yunnana]|nr:hypothetical protein FQA39_LY05005 [Lamprigera yunnana]
MMNQQDKNFSIGIDSISSCETPMIPSNRATTNVEGAFNPKTKDSTNNLRARSDKKSNFTLKSPNNELLEENGVGTVQNPNRKFFTQIDAWKTLHSSTPVEKNYAEPLNQNSRVLQDEIATTFSVHSKPTIISNTTKSPTNELLEDDSVNTRKNSNRKFFAQIDPWKTLHLTPAASGNVEGAFNNSKTAKDDIVDIVENTNKKCIALDTLVFSSDSICSEDSLCNLDQNSKIFEDVTISLSAGTSKSLVNASTSQKILTSSGAFEKTFNNFNETNRILKNDVYQKIESRKTKFTKMVPYSWKALKQNGLSKKFKNIPSNKLLCINKQLTPSINIEQMAIDKCNHFLKKHNESFMDKSHLQEINTHKQHINIIHKNQTDISQTMNELDFTKKSEFENSIKPHLTLQSHKAEMECEVGEANLLMKHY